MRRTFLSLTGRTLAVGLTALCVSISVEAQSLKVNMGEVTYSHAASHTGDMTFAGGKTLTIQGKTYTLADVDSINIDNTTTDDNTVSVVYNGSAAHVTVAGNLAPYLTITAKGADISIVASADCKEKIVYTLTGSSTNGSFYMDGEEGATLNLNSLSLTSTTGGAITIDDGKKILVNVNGTNVLSDAATGAQKACLYINGHAVINGTGQLSVTGNAKHAYFSDEYTEFDGPTMTVPSSASDGLHVNQYFTMKSGTVTVTDAKGDGIDVGKTKDATDKDNGCFFLNGGTISLTTTGQGTKGVKADSTITVTDGTLTVNCQSSAYYDTTDADISSGACLKSGYATTISGGTLNLTATGDGGKGINAGSTVTVSGGHTVVTTTGATFVYGAGDSKPQGVKSDADIVVNGGEIYVCASSGGGKAFSTDYDFTINGGTLLGIGAKKGEPTGGTQTYKTFKGQNIVGGSTVTFNGVSYTIPSIYSNSSARVVASKAN